GRRRPRHRGVHPRLLPSRARPVPRGDGDEAVARDAQEPEAAQAPRAIPRRERQALLQARHRAPGPAIQTRPRLLATAAAAVPPPPPDGKFGEVSLTADEIAARVAQLGTQIGEDYAGREPILIGCLKSSFIFLADLSRALPIVHRIDFVELAGYGGPGTGGSGAPRRRQDPHLCTVRQANAALA